MDPTPEYTWSPPQYDTSKPPSLDAVYALADTSSPSTDFPRSAKWSPDGSVFLAHCERPALRLFETSLHDAPVAPALPILPVRTFEQPSPVLDYAWYPTASPSDPASFCFVASVRECPVKLLDASDGRLRASYPIVDHRERQVAPHSLAFNNTMDKLYCGFEDAVEVFDVSRPGQGTRLPTTPSKKSRDGLSGVLAALAFSSAQGSDMYAVGSLAIPSTTSGSNLALFSETHGPEPVMFVGGAPRAGVSQLLFDPARPHILYASFRRRGLICSWDVRADTDRPMREYRFCVEDGAQMTNQRMRFHVDYGGRWLGVGDQTGNVSLFDLGNDQEDERAREIKPTIRFKAHDDAVGSVAFHPFRPLVLSVSGSRHFVESESESESDDDEDEDESGSDATGSEHHEHGAVRRHPVVSYDSSLKVWNWA